MCMQIDHSCGVSNVRFIDDDTALENRLSMFATKRYHSNVALIDINNFSLISQEYGLELSGRLLHDFFMNVINSINSDKYKIYRYGVDIAAVCSDCQDNEFEKFVCQLSKKMWFYYYKDDLTHEIIPVFLTIGASISKSGRENTIYEAEKMLIECKTRKVPYLVRRGDFIDSAEEHGLKYRRISKEISFFLRSVNLGNIRACYHPILDVKSWKIVKTEALARIIEDEVVYSPKDFLGSVEYLNMTHILFGEMFKQAWEVARKIPVSINITSSDMVRHDHLENFIELMREDITRAQNITFEILETADDITNNVVSKFIQTVKQFGCRIAIDDFGMAYSNFNRILCHSGVDYVKIDGSIVQESMVNKTAETIVSCIVEMCRSAGIKTIAEFVSTEEIAKKMIHCGVDMLQGYYISEELILADIHDFTADWNRGVVANSDLLLKTASAI